jgi:CBS domain-containing protein
MPTVSNLLGGKKRELFSIDQDKSVADAIQQMVEHEVGALIVMKDGKPTGMFTERDVLKCYMAKESTKWFREVPVKDAMSTNLIVVESDEDLCYVVNIMIKNRIRHLPVVAEKELVGMISIRDVVKAQVTNLRAENHYLKEYLFSDYPG